MATAIDALPTGPCQNTFLKSATPKSTANCKNKSYDNIESDHLDNDDNNDNNDDDDDVVDCFPWQYKEPVLPQDNSSTLSDATLLSLIESPTDKLTNTNYTNNNIK